MATSSTYHGLRRGSTKSHTYSVVGGKQITKDRVEGGKNPRTPKQMARRCMLTTVSAAYGAMKAICNHSFEGKSAGRESMREFMHSNMQQLTISKEYDNGLFGFCKYQESGLIPGSYILSDGDLPKPLLNAVVESVDVENQKILLTLVTTANGTIPEVAAAMSCKKFNDMCTVAIMYPKANGFYGFAAVRFTYVSGTSVMNSFTIGIHGDAMQAVATFNNKTLKLEVLMENKIATTATSENTYIVSLASRQSNDKWQYSSAQFDVQGAKPTFSEAIATYPIGEELFLHGGGDAGSIQSGGNTNSGVSDSTDSGNQGSSTGGNENQGGTDPDPDNGGSTPGTGGFDSGD